jgi:hypothetical protein
VYLKCVQHCTAYVCFLHFDAPGGAVGLRGVCERDLGVGHLHLFPTLDSPPGKPHFRHGSRQLGRLSCRGGKECAAHLSCCTPPVLAQW